MPVRKRLLFPERVRRPPREGFSWIDRRFLRDEAPRLTRDAIFVYFFLAAVSDKEGLSFYDDPSIAARLRIGIADLIRAREELVCRDLVAYDRPLYQVLSLPDRSDGRSQSEPESLGDLLRRAYEANKARLSSSKTTDGQGGAGR